VIYRTHAETSIEGEAVVCDVPALAYLPPLPEPPGPEIMAIFALILLLVIISIVIGRQWNRARGTMRLLFRSSTRRF
jgi:hypothetical protein